LVLPWPHFRGSARACHLRESPGEKGGSASIDGETPKAPYRVSAIGDPAKLAAGAESIAASLKARGRVSVEQSADLRIVSTVPERPVIYSAFGS